MDGPPPPSISEMSGSSYRTIELELDLYPVVGEESCLPLPGPIMNMCLFPPLYPHEPNPFGTHPVPVLSDYAQQQSSNTIPGHHDTSPLLYITSAPPNNEVALFQAVQNCCPQQHSTHHSTAIDSLLDWRPSSTDTESSGHHTAISSDTTLLSPLPPIYSELSLVRARRLRRPRDNSRRKEKVVCKVNGCRKVLSRDSLTRHKKEVHMGLKRRSKGKVDAIVHAKHNV